jgi:hypothetical protein
MLCKVPNKIAIIELNFYSLKLKCHFETGSRSGFSCFFFNFSGKK